MQKGSQKLFEASRGENHKLLANVQEASRAENHKLPANEQELRTRSYLKLLEPKTKNCKQKFCQKLKSSSNHQGQQKNHWYRGNCVTFRKDRLHEN